MGILSDFITVSLSKALAQAPCSVFTLSHSLHEETKAWALSTFAIQSKGYSFWG